MTALTWGAFPRSWKHTESPLVSGWAAPRDATTSLSGLLPHSCPGPQWCGSPGALSAATPAAPAPACAPRGCAWAGPHSLSFFCTQDHEIYINLPVQKQSVMIRRGVNYRYKWVTDLIVKVILIDLKEEIRGGITLGDAPHRAWRGVKCRVKWIRFYSSYFACWPWWPVKIKMKKKSPKHCFLVSFNSFTSMFLFILKSLYSNIWYDKRFKYVTYQHKNWYAG